MYCFMVSAMSLEKQPVYSRLHEFKVNRKQVFSLLFVTALLLSSLVVLIKIPTVQAESGEAPTYVAVASWVSPLAQQYNSSTVNFEVSTVGSNDTGVALQIQLYDEGGAVYAENFTSATGSFTGLVNGTYTAAVYAVGDHGASDYETVVFTVSITTSEDAPVLTIVSPFNRTYITSTFNVEITYTGTAALIWFNVKNGSSWVYESNTTYTAATSLTGYTDGTYTFYAFAINNEGETDEESTVFTVGIIANPILPQVNVDTYWLFLQEGDFLGAVQALLVSTFLSFEAAIAMIVMLFMIPIYLRTKSLLLLSILWILIGSFFVVAVPMASGIGILFIALAIGGLLWRLFRPSGYG